MGVLSCDRSGCANIMCDRYSYTHGYICNECFDELVGIGIMADVAVFMDSPKTNRRPDLAELAGTRFNLEFPDRQ